MRRTSIVAIIVIATVGLLLTGVAAHGNQHGWETRFIWCAVLACVYAAVLMWLVDAAGLIRVMIHSRRCSCEGRYSTTAAYVGGHARGCILAESGFAGQQSVSPTLDTAALIQASTELGWEELAGSRSDECSEWSLA